MHDNMSLFEDRFSQINITKSPTRRKKYPSHLYPNKPSFNDENESSQSSHMKLSPKTPIRSTSYTQHRSFSTIKSNAKRESSSQTGNYPLSEQSNSKKDYQFSFMKETSSSMQKRSVNPFNIGIPSIPNLPSSATKKRLEYSRQLSSRRRILSNTASREQCPSNFIPISTSPSKRSTSGYHETLKNSPSKQKRNFTQPLPNSNVFKRLYPKPNSNNSQRRKPISTIRNDPSKIETIAQLYQTLYKGDPNLFNDTASHPEINNQIPSHSLPLDKLNIYERGEIIRKDEIYYIPTNLPVDDRIINIKNYSQNFGFDDSQGNYNIVIDDHINYRYQILNILGNGSFGNVILAKDWRYKSKIVAIKIIKNNLDWSIQSINEIKVLKNINRCENPNIVQFYDHFNFRSHMCIITEALSINLYTMLEMCSFQGLSISLIREFATQILHGIGHLHSMNIIHCDIKPENIMMKLPQFLSSNELSIKLIDFGSSCFANEASFTYIQSRYYRAPEVIIGALYSEKIDLWSVGCVLVELFTGQPLLPGKNELDQIGLILELFGAPKTSSILKMRLKQENEKKNKIENVNEKQLKKALLYKIFDINGRLNINLLNTYHNQQSSSVRKQFKPSSKSLSTIMGLSVDKDSSGEFLSFLQKIFIWDPIERASVEDLLNDAFL